MDIFGSDHIHNNLGCDRNYIQGISKKSIYNLKFSQVIIEVTYN